MPDEETRIIEKLVREIENLKLGLDPNVLAGWYRKVENDAKARTPEHLRDSIQVIQNEILPMKFEFKTSKRAVRYVLEAIDRNLAEMPMATRLYFQKLSELIQAEMNR
jgi:transposase-like protein